LVCFFDVPPPAPLHHTKKKRVTCKDGGTSFGLPSNDTQQFSKPQKLNLTTQGSGANLAGKTIAGVCGFDKTCQRCSAKMKSCCLKYDLCAGKHFHFISSIQFE
jgi:hypothetical protein